MARKSWRDLAGFLLYITLYRLSAARQVGSYLNVEANQLKRFTEHKSFISIS
jgi:hypothetical protein